MAYAEKRGKGPKPWRVRYKKPDGTWDSESGFPTKVVALKRGRKLEADVDEGKYVDPRKGKTPLGDWTPRWMAAQTVAPRTVATWHRLLDRHIMPRWATTPLMDINWFDVKAWTGTLTCAESTRDHSVTLLSMMLTGAADAGYIAANPLYRRRRTNISNSNSARPQKAWAYPSQALAIAGRATSPADRLMIITAAWTGMRWGELCGLHRSNCGLLRRDKDGSLTLNRRIIRIDPKAGALHEVEVRLTDEELEEWDARERERLEKAARLGKSTKPRLRPRNRVELYLGPPKPPNGPREIDVPPFLADLLDKHMATWPHEYLFTGVRGGWHCRKNFNARVIKPAADGRPGKPRKRGRAEVPAWEPILPGLRMHGLRHSHKTWMIEDEIAEVLQCEQLGHELGGIRGVYSHPSVAMRIKRLDALQARWERALKERRETA